VLSEEREKQGNLQGKINLATVTGQCGTTWHKMTEGIVKMANKDTF